MFTNPIIVLSQLATCLLVLATTASAQWVHMDVSRTNYIYQLGWCNGGVEIASNSKHLFRRVDARSWELIDEVYAGPSGDVIEFTAWADTVVALTSKVAGNSRCVAWMSADAGLTWTSHELGTDDNRLIPKSRFVVRGLRINDSTLSIERVDISKAELERDTFLIDHSFGGMTFKVASKEIMIYDWWTYSTPGVDEVVRLYNVTRPMSEWETESFEVHSSPFEIVNIGIGVWSSDSPSEQDSLFLFNGDFKDTILADLGSFSLAPYGLFVDTNGYNTIRNRMWYESVDGEQWRLIDSISSALRGAVLIANKGTVYFNSFQGSPFSYDRERKQIAYMNEGMSTFSYEMLVEHDRIVINNCMLEDASGIISWSDSEQTPMLSFVPGGTWSRKIVNDRLWLLHGSNRFIDLKTGVVDSISRGLLDACEFNGKTLVLSNDSIFHMSEANNELLFFHHDEAHMQHCIGLESVGDTVIVFRWYNTDIDAIDFGALLYDSAGTKLGASSVGSGMLSQTDARTQPTFGGKRAAIAVAGRQYVSGPKLSVWGEVYPGNVTDAGIWEWRADKDEIRFFADNSESYVAIKTPPLNYVSVQAVCCLTNNCYAATDAGVYRLPRTQTNVSDSESKRPLTVSSIGGTLTVYTISGVEVMTRDVKENENVELSFLPSGVYIVTIVNKTSVVSKLLMQRN